MLPPTGQGHMATQTVASSVSIVRTGNNRIFIIITDQ